MTESGPSPVPYPQLPGFAGYYFEDGWVLGVYPSDRQFVIDIEAVLTKEHPDFGPPKPGETHRYLRVAIRFPNVRQLRWMRPLNLRGAHDADGSVDYGNVDFFVREGGVSHLGGDWGEASITSDMPVIDRIHGA